MRGFAILAVAAMAFWIGAAAHAQAGCQGTGFNFCSKTFYASAPCNGQDQLASIGKNNCARGPKNCHYCESGQDCPLIETWEPTMITIVGVEITVWQGSSALNYAYAGNGFHPNQMAFVGASQSHTRQMFPAGTGFHLPPPGTNGFINLHIHCKPEIAARVDAWYTIYYTVAGAASEQKKD